jgi:UDP-N-acetylglucosamine:LPS N-acetylglucosamine transferase
VVYAYAPTNRSVKNLVRNAVLAVRIVRRLRPRVVLSTGAGVAVPFAWAGRLFGARVVYVESFTRIEEPSLSCRLIAPIADRVYAQWPELPHAFPRARYVGNVFSDS